MTGPAGEHSLVLLDRSGAVATITLNRPERHNSLIPPLLDQFLATLEFLAREDTIRAVVLSAAGTSFSTGGDVRAFFEAAEPEPYARRVVGLLNECVLAMIRLPQPIVAAVHGIVTGGSLGFLLGSDVVLMSPKATITPWYPEVGFSPDGGWTAILPDLIGRKRCALILMRNESISAEDAVSWGIASDIVPPATIRERALALAGEIASMKQGSITQAKRLLHRDVESVAARLEQERRSFVEQFLTPDARSGMAGYLGAP